MKTLQERFWSKVNKTQSVDDCWEWNAAIGSDGYGVFHWDTKPKETRSPTETRSKLIKAHRASILLDGRSAPEYTGKADGFEILHTCDNKRCVNPNHLEIGTHLQNIRDYHTRGKLKQNARKQNHA